MEVTHRRIASRRKTPRWYGTPMGWLQPMSIDAPGGQNPHDSGIELEQRSVRALTECMTVLPLGGDVYSVTTESGSEYRVDALEGRCTCPDARHNLDDDERCKHERRVRFSTGQRAIPQWVDTDAVDPQLGDHVEGGPVAVASDGGEVVVSDGEPHPSDEQDTSADDNSDDCEECAGLPDGCPCFECFSDGATFEEV